jgi:hypothetical protein
MMTAMKFRFVGSRDASYLVQGPLAFNKRRGVILLFEENIEPCMSCDRAGRLPPVHHVDCTQNTT